MDADDNAESIATPPSPGAEDDIFLPKQPAEGSQNSAVGSVDENKIETPAATPAAPIPRRKRLTSKQRKLIRVLSRNPEMPLDEAGRRAGYSDPSTVSRVLKSPSVQELFREAMERHPALKRESIVNKLAEGLDANQTKFFAHEGNVQDERTTIDFGVRHSYLALAAKLGGYEPATKSELTGANGTPLLPGGALLDLSWITKDQLIRLIEMTEYPLEAPRSADAQPIIDAELVIAGGAVVAAPAGSEDAQDAADEVEGTAGGSEQGA